MGNSICLLSFCLAVGSFLGLTLGGILLFVKSSRNAANVFLGLITLGFTFYMLPSLLNSFGMLETIPHIINVGSLFGLTLGPLIYLYVVACTQKDFKMKPILWIHFAPAALYFIPKIPFLLSSGEEKLTHFAEMVQGGRMLDASTQPIIGAFHALLYFGLSVKLVLVYKKRLVEVSTAAEQVYYRWLLFFCATLLLPLSVISIYVLPGFAMPSVGYCIVSFFCFIIAIYGALILKPQIFHTFPTQIKKKELQTNLFTEHPIKKERYWQSNLVEHQKERYLKKLLTHIETEKSYLQPELTLNNLSEELNIPVHHLSQVINEKLACNFLDFINRYRVEETKEKFMDETNNHLGTLSIAFEAGFNSKTAFYGAFKKQTGTTPAKYRKAVMMETNGLKTA